MVPQIFFPMLVPCGLGYLHGRNIILCVFNVFCYSTFHRFTYTTKGDDQFGIMALNDIFASHLATSFALLVMQISPLAMTNIAILPLFKIFSPRSGFCAFLDRLLYMLILTSSSSFGINCLPGSFQVPPTAGVYEKPSSAALEDPTLFQDTHYFLLGSLRKLALIVSSKVKSHLL